MHGDNSPPMLARPRRWVHQPPHPVPIHVYYAAQLGVPHPRMLPLGVPVARCIALGVSGGGACMHVHPQCLSRDTVFIRIRTWTRRPPTILCRLLTITYHTNRPGGRCVAAYCTTLACTDGVKPTCTNYRTTMRMLARAKAKAVVLPQRQIQPVSTISGPIPRHP